MSDPRDLPTLADAPVVAPDPEPASHDDRDEPREAAPVEPGEEVEP